MKRLLSMLLAVCMVLTMLPMTVFGVEPETQTQTVTLDNSTADESAETTAAAETVPETTAQQETVAVETTAPVAEDTGAVISDETTAPTEEPAVQETAVGYWQYEFYGDGLVIIGYTGDATDVYVPGVLEIDGEEYQVIKLGDRLFYDMDGLNSVTMGPGITEIGSEVFYDCDTMVCVLPSEELTTVRSNAFYSCDSFNSIIFYEALSSVAEDAFTDCISLTVWCTEGSYAHTFADAHSIRYQLLNAEAVPETYEQDGFTYYIMNGEAIAIDYDQSATEVVVPATVAGYPVTELRETFRDFSTLTSVTLPDTLKSIGDYSFYNCKNLASITLPGRVSNIGAYAFYYCRNITRLDLPKTVKTIGAYAFYYCDGLTQIAIPEGVEVIQAYTFYYCSRMTSVVLPESLTSIGSYAFYYLGGSYLRGVVDITIPKNVTLIDTHAFRLSRILSLTLQGEQTKINGYAFERCTYMEELVFDGANTELTSSSFNSPYYGTSADGTQIYYNYKIKKLIINGNITGSPDALLSYCDTIAEVVIGEDVTNLELKVKANHTPYVEIPATVTSGLTASSFKSSLWLVYEGSYAHTVAQENEGTVRYYVIDAVDSQDIVIQDGIYYYIRNGEATAFSSDYSLTEATVAAQVNGYPVTTLDRTFYTRSNLVSAEIPAGVTSFVGPVFSECSSLTVVNIPDGVTVLDDYAFYKCSALTSITLPDNLSQVGAYAFYQCSALTEATIPGSVGNYAFYKCTALTEVTVSGSIGDYVFYSCSALQTAILEDGVSSIGSYAFGYCDALTAITIPDSVTGIGNYAFLWCTALQTAVVGSGVTSWGSGAFENCKALQELTLSEGLTSIGWRAFRFCYNLAVIDLPDTLTVIGGGAFDSTSISEIKLPDGLQSIGSQAFYGCDLVEIVIPDSVTSISSGAFYRCNKLVSATLPAGITAIPENMFVQCTSLETVNIPETVTSIGSMAFYQCTSLNELSLPDGLKTLASNAFRGCTGLAAVELPTSLTQIGGYAFADCAGLTSIVIPAGVNYINNGTFENCTSLTEVVISSGAKRIYEEVFSGCSSLKIMYLPDTVTSIDTSAIPKGTFLFVVENSYAHTFAENNSYPYFFWDGVNKPEFYTQDGVDYVLYNGEAIAIFCDPSLTTVTIPAAVKDCPVVEIRAAFKDCTNLTQVTLPEGLKIIGVNAFDGCTGLTSITIPSTVTQLKYRAFAGCTRLTEVTVPDGVTELGDTCFDQCTALTKVVIPDSVTVFQNGVFRNCKKLDQIVLPEGLTSMGRAVFAYCTSLTQINIPVGVTSIPQEGFYGCTKLETVTGMEGVTGIGLNAFENCTLLKNIQIPSKLTKLSSRAFYNCDALTEITLPGCLTAVGTYSFDGCDGLTKVTLEPGVPCVAAYMFSGCDALQEVILGDGMDRIEQYAFYNCGALQKVEMAQTVKTIGAYAFDNCTVLADITLPEGLTNIYSYAFRNCDGLTQITIPGSVTSIAQYAFTNCDSLKTVNLTYGLKTIGTNAFRVCTALESITLPASLTTLGAYSFYYCTKLKDVHIYGNTTGSALSISSSVFGGTKLKNVTVTGGKVSIGASAFSGQTALESFTVENSAVTIGDTAFSGCTGLTSVNLEGTTSIGANAFANCQFLMAYVPATVTSMQVNSFRSNVILLVYENSYAHQFAAANNLLYFIIRDTGNPEIAYGTGITGTVTYSGGGAAAGVNVELLYDDGSVKETVVTDDNGAYEFTYAEVGRYTIRVVDNAGKAASEQVSVKRMNVFDVFLAGDTNLVLKTGWNVSGTVSQYPATVSITDQDGNVIASVESADGTFVLEDIPDGAYILKAQSDAASVAQEITVYQGDLTGITLELPTSVAAIWGYVEVESREKKRDRRNWVQVTLYNSDGTVVDQCKSDGDGMYRFNNVPLGEYTIVAETAEMRPDKHKGYKRSYTLTGYAYVDASAAGEYQADDIVLYEENDYRATISGKVTAKGQTQVSEVILRNVFRHEVARIKTGNNGKYIFSKVRDGLYFIMATTESDGMGFTMVAVRNGNVYGETDITVYKTDKIKDREDRFKNEVPECNSREDVIKHRDRIAEEKRYYDGLSQKEKKQLSKDYVDRLNRYSEWLSECEYVNDEDVQVQQGGLVVSGDELENEDTVVFTLDVQKRDKWEVSSDGVNTREDYIQHAMEDTAGDREIVQYYEISMTKDKDGICQTITSVSKDTDATGKFRITMPIPEEYRGHKHYSFVHVHNGVPVTLVDLDDDPDTVTFEVDEFSTFALTYTDEELASQYETVYGLPYETDPMEGGASMAYAIYGASGMILSIADPNAYVIYNDVTYGAGENGIVSVQLDSTDPRTPTMVTVGNASDGVLVFTLTGSYPLGSYANPDTLTLGENTAAVEAGDPDGYCYTWTAPDDGELTITMDENAEWSYMVENLTAGIYGDTCYSDTDTAPSTYTMQVRSGDVVCVNVNTCDPEDIWNPPAGSVIFQAAFKNYVIQVGQSKYPTLEAAVSAAQAGDTVKLLDNVTVPALAEGVYEYDLDVSGLTIDLNGKTLSVPKLALVFVGDGFTVTNGTIDGIGASYALWIGGDTAATNVRVENVTTVGGINVYNSENVTLSNVTATGVSYYAVWADEQVTNLAIKSGSYTGAAGKAAVLACQGSQIVISGGTFSTEPDAAYCAEGIVPVANADGTYGVANAVACIGETGYATLAGAVAAAQTGDTVVLLTDVTLTEKLTVTEDITLDLAGNSLTTAAVSGNYSVVVKGNLTVTGQGTVYVNGVYGIGVTGGLTVESGNFAAAADNNDYLIGSWGTTVINGGTFQGVYNAVNCFAGTLTITGGAFSTEETDSTGEYAAYDVLGNSGVAITGGTYSKPVFESHCAEGYIPTLGADGAYTVKVGAFVAAVNDNKYETLEAAVTAARPGDTVLLLDDVTVPTLNEGVYEYDLDVSGLTIDLNGKTLYVPKLALVFVGDGFTVTNGTVDGMGASYALWIGGDTAATNVRVENVTTVGGINVYNSGNVTLSNVAATGVSYYAVWADEQVTSLTIESGSYTGAAGKAAVLACQGSQIVITGGTYSTDVTDYCATGLEASLNEEGVYTIEPIKLFDLAGTTLNLGNSLSVNFVIDIAKLRGDGHYAVITKTNADGTTKTVSVDQADWAIYGGSLYYFSFNGVAAKEMTDTMSVIVYNADGIQVTNEKLDSIESYCIRMLATEEQKSVPSQKTMTMYVDMLNYGAQAQAYFGYNTENLANARLTDAQQAYATQSVQMEDVRQKGTGYVGSTLTLQCEINLNFVYRNTTIANAAYAVATYTDHYGNAKSMTYQASEFQAYNDSMTYIPVGGMNVADCGQAVTVTLYDADGNVLSTTVDSVESYVCRMSGDLYQAVMKFAAAAYNYFHE